MRGSKDRQAGGEAWTERYGPTEYASAPIMR